ncbi:MAG: hypothetical protein VW520_06660, partial [Candidatus Puniceispirillum sp.]
SGTANALTSDRTDKDEKNGTNSRDDVYSKQKIIQRMVPCRPVKTSFTCRRPNATSRNETT